MLKALAEQYGYLFEEALLQEINSIGIYISVDNTKNEGDCITGHIYFHL